MKKLILSQTFQSGPAREKLPSLQGHASDQEDGREARFVANRCQFRCQFRCWYRCQFRCKVVASFVSKSLQNCIFICNLKTNQPRKSHVQTNNLNNVQSRVTSILSRFLLQLLRRGDPQTEILTNWTETGPSTAERRTAGRNKRESVFLDISKEEQLSSFFLSVKNNLLDRINLESLEKQKQIRTELG